MDPTFEAARAAFTAGVQAFEAGDLPRAEALFVESLAHVPARPSTLANLALVRQRLGRPAEALALVEQALEAQPEDVAAWFHRGQLLQQLERPFDALAAYERLLALDATHATAWMQRGSLLKDMGRHGEAAECFRQALAHGGDEELNRYFLASALTASPASPTAAGTAGGTEPTHAAPAAAPRHYVQALFDSYAEGFDEHLVAKLGYRTPWLLAQLLGVGGDGDSGAPLRPTAPAPPPASPPASPPAAPRWRAALDLGCGTGLLGPLLTPHCAAIDGVDLSPLMLHKAQALGCYRQLAHADVVEHLQATAQRYDLVAAADVFVYLGELQPLFAGVARVLGPGGLFAFSVEEATGAQVRYELRPSSRYAHGEAYLRELAAAVGFEVRELARTVLRHEQRQPIGGLLVLLARPAG
jgi:predicted TPR repeat methyltransferase